ncbi:hypothetical protein CYY_004218 [Polysphondylium violaceum]|uniref:Uncharacterized protein n=1 Tax=Polysphondylium violaceum TaxID=133409 RepID=A0A8J4V0H6_9MYCE|nr:hypothetical protein CYY_004218 [Polysphondylium violaceum]
MKGIFKKLIYRIRSTWINIILFFLVVAVFVLNLVSVIIDTKDEFDLSKLESLLDKQNYIFKPTLLPQLEEIHKRLHISLITSVFILFMDFILFVFLCYLVFKSHKSMNEYLEEEESLLKPNNEGGNKNNSNITSSNSNSSHFHAKRATYSIGGTSNPYQIPHNHHDRSSVVIEGPIYEPWNQVTIEKISSEDIKADEKIRNAIYRYGNAAGRIIYERFYQELSQEDNRELSRILGFPETTITSNYTTLANSYRNI